MSRRRKPNPPNKRRKRYSLWLDRAAKLLKENGKAQTAQWLLQELPDDRHSPTTSTSAAQKLRRDRRFDSFEDYTTDGRGNQYYVRFYFYVGDGSE